MSEQPEEAERSEEKPEALTIHAAAARALAVGRWILLAYNVLVVVLVVLGATGVLTEAARSRAWAAVIAGLGASVLILTGLVNLLVAILFRHAHPGWTDMRLAGRILLMDVPLLGLHAYRRYRREWGRHVDERT
ncbi:MAG: hypothetical protein ACOC8E_07190 [Planctomycetota bacterium]